MIMALIIDDDSMILTVIVDDRIITVDDNSW